jgi:hypothetical protein
MRELRAILGDYEITFEPVMTPPGLKWAPYVSVAVAPYRVTRLPRCRVHGLHDALTKAGREQSAGEWPTMSGRDDDGADVITLDTHRVGRLLRHRFRSSVAAR